MKKIVFFVICEGLSEANYLQELNRFFRENGIPLIMRPFPAESGHFTDVSRKYRETYKTAKHRERNNPEVVIWVDNDIYVRNDLGNADKYQKKSHMPDFLFSYMNFEDFLTLHNTALLEKWTSICEKNNHFKVPMRESDYKSLYAQEIFMNYKKGELPLEFVIDNSSIQTLIANNREAIGYTNKIRSDFACFLEAIFRKLKIEI